MATLVQCSSPTRRLSIVGYRRLSPAIAGYCRLLSAIAGYCRLLSAIVGYCRLLSAIVGYCRLLSAIVGYCRLLSAIVGYCRLLSAIVGYCRLLSAVVCSAAHARVAGSGLGVGGCLGTLVFHLFRWLCSPLSFCTSAFPPRSSLLRFKDVLW